MSALLSCSRPPAAPPASSTPLTIGPITYYQQSCARCHGPYGSMYDETTLAAHSSADLRAVVERMVLGPAQSSLPAPDVDALTAYHRSLADGRPFFAVVGSLRALTITGECTPGSSVWVTLGATRLDATVADHSWTVALPAPPASAAAPNPITVTAELDGDEARRTTISVPPDLFSHARPAPPP